ncbi:hypothetical protein VSR68_08740 [Paraburkholderia phymatum]
MMIWTVDSAGSTRGARIGFPVSDSLMVTASELGDTSATVVFLVAV